MDYEMDDREPVIAEDVERMLQIRLRESQIECLDALKERGGYSTRKAMISDALDLLAAKIDSPPLLWIMEWGAVSLPAGHPSRVTCYAGYRTEAEAREESAKCDFDSRVYPVGPFLDPRQPQLGMTPIARLVIDEDDKVTASLYAPGLPPGEHDVYPEPCDPAGAAVPFMAAEPTNVCTTPEQIDAAFDAIFSQEAQPSAPAAVAPTEWESAECERCGEAPGMHTLSHWCDNQSFRLAATPPAPAAQPAQADDAAPDIAFRLRMARMMAELHGEEVLSEQQCARYMGIDLVSWRRLEHCFSAGTSFVEGEGDDNFPTEDSETVLRAALAARQSQSPGSTT